MAYYPPENNLAVNQAVKFAFDQAGCALPENSLFILSAMRWGIEHDVLAEWRTERRRWRLGDKAERLFIENAMDTIRFLFGDGKGGINEVTANDSALIFRESTPEEVSRWVLEILEDAMKLPPDQGSDSLPENDLSVNEATRAIFQNANEPLRGTRVYVLEAMVWRLESELPLLVQEEIRDDMAEKVAEMHDWEPMRVMRFMYDDGRGNLDAEMQGDVDLFQGQKPETVASFLLARLWGRLG